MNLAAVWNLRSLWPGYGGQRRARVGGQGRRNPQISRQSTIPATASEYGQQAFHEDVTAGVGKRRIEYRAQSDTSVSAPQGSLTEICTLMPASGQAADSGLCQLLPALADSCQSRWLMLVAPPMIPSAQQFLAAGIDPSRVLLLHPRGGNGLLAIEQALRSGNCGAVLVWLQQGDEQTSRRLRRAAEVGRCWGVLFRSSTPAGHEAPVAQYQLGLSY